MADLIDRAKSKEFPIRIDHYDETNGNKDFVLGIETVMEYVDNLPAVDAVEVVRCKDCEYFKLFSDGYAKCKHKYGLAQITTDTFCSRGERRDDDE